MQYEDKDVSCKLKATILAAALDQATLGIAVVDTRQRYVQINKLFSNIMEMDSERLIGRTIYEVMCEKFGAVQAEKLTNIAKQIITTGGCYTINEWKSLNGWQYIDWTLKRLELDGVAIALLVTIADVSKHVQLRREVETYQQQLAHLVAKNTAELRRANEQFYAAFNVMPSLMSISDQQGRILNANSSFVKVTGWKKEEVIGRTPVEIGLWSQAVFEDIEYKFWQEGYVRNMEITLMTKAGQIRSALFSAEKIVVDGDTQILGMATDVTDAKLMKSEMMRLDGLDLVGQMAAGISHEVRNPMTTVRGFLQMLLKKEECKPYQEYFELMITELDRANSIISEFLAVVKNKPSCHVETDLNTIIKAIEPLLATAAVASGSTVVLELGKIRCLLLDDKEIRQLLLNLVRNGLEAMEQPGVVTVRTYEEEDQVVLAIQDQGIGIPPQILAKLGTPFLTSKNNGTGLGLTVCYGIVERHKGKIEVATGAEGTTFYIRFSQ
ncbi:PAS domain-containing sensor histidine kinase [Sporomusa sp. KB1]|uniref:PAS domain-containing sensor histidine kinase n=1 Tax=Sporomusa sp. KB1 TaxID=943346 RepID=UPI0011ABEAB3|nr:PAS domain-containing sensor histidine kinase [Sporomusa sp. KB1]TWH46594.1 PAS domain S-box-containing protein [Sporomusa sp. KB1]